MTKICVIAAFDENKGVGIDNALPWNMPKDLLRFKSLTQNNPIIMGRKTFESLPSLLPNRTHIILTNSREWKKEAIKNHPEIIVLFSWDEIYEWINEFSPEKVFVIGGPSLWEHALKISDTFYLTKIKGNFPVDTYFPDFDESKWNKTNTEEYPDFTFVDFKNKNCKQKIKPVKLTNKPEMIMYIEDLQIVLKSKKLKESEKVRFANTNIQNLSLFFKLITQSVNKEINFAIKIRDEELKEEKIKWFKERFEEYELFLI